MDNSKDLRTSSIELISSTHGRQRRLERDISKKDLQLAIKYGVIERQYGSRVSEKNRYKITYNNIVYITDETMTREVTSYSELQLPLEKYPIDVFLSRQIIEQRRRIKAGIAKITSHTVIIVDQSTSMNNGDVMGHRSRSRSAYYQIANEMIAQPLLREHLSFTDIVTIIEMREDVIVNPSLYMEPCTWELHNKVVDLANDPLRGRGHGNYFPALLESFKILNSTDNPNAALLLLFLSDGRPSDSASSFKHCAKRTRLHESRAAILHVIEQICGKFRERLTFGAFGFAFEDGELFEFLKTMTETAKTSCSNAVFASGIDTQSLRKALYTMSTSLMSTRTHLSSIAGNSLLNHRQNQMIRTEKKAEPGVKGNDGNDLIFNESEYKFYFVKSDDLKRYSYVPRRDNDELMPFVPRDLQHPSAKGFAMKKEYIGEGAERIVFECTEVDQDGKPVGQPLVAKLFWSKNDSEQLPFHKLAGRTQIEANRLARKFNERLENYQLHCPKIEFLEVSFYTVNKETASYLIEKRLDRYRYTKYNNNKGGVKDLNMDMKAIDFNAPDVQLHQDETEMKGPDDPTKLSAELQLDVDRIIDDDIPQAFSHWSYNYTYGELLICDLQGVLGKNFVLTDPAINSWKRGVHGDTDLGVKGQTEFFKTHKCNPVCRILHLKRVTY